MYIPMTLRILLSSLAFYDRGATITMKYIYEGTWHIFKIGKVTVIANKLDCRMIWPGLVTFQRLKCVQTGWGFL